MLSGIFNINLKLKLAIERLNQVAKKLDSGKGTVFYSFLAATSEVISKECVVFGTGQKIIKLFNCVNTILVCCFQTLFRAILWKPTFNLEFN